MPYYTYAGVQQGKFGLPERGQRPGKKAFAERPSFPGRLYFSRKILHEPFHLRQKTIALVSMPFFRDGVKQKMRPDASGVLRQESKEEK